MLTLTLIQAAIFTAYVSFIISKFGVLPSISESFYRLNENRLGLLFTLFCWTLAVPMMFQSNETTLFFFFSAVGLGFVGATPMFKWSGAMTDKIHGAGAGIGIACGLAGLYFEYHMWEPFVGFLLVTGAILGFKLKDHIWWIEIMAFLAIITGLLLRLTHNTF